MVILARFGAVKMGTNGNVIFVGEIDQFADNFTYLYIDCSIGPPLASFTQEISYNCKIDSCGLRLIVGRCAQSFGLWGSVKLV